jgi:hypothetical protein
VEIVGVGVVGGGIGGLCDVVEREEVMRRCGSQ